MAAVDWGRKGGIWICERCVRTCVLSEADGREHLIAMLARRDTVVFEAKFTASRGEDLTGMLASKERN